MGTILASELIVQASEIAEDQSNVTWTETQILGWLNEAQKIIASLRADASVTLGVVLLVSGTKQSIVGRRLMDVVRNMGSDGITPGKAVRLVERGIKDDFNPDWHADATSMEIKEYIYDVRVPDEYYVYPPVSSSHDIYVETLEATVPADVATASNSINVSDIYAPNLMEWMLFRIFCRDAEQVPDAQRAATHFSNFFTMMGEKLKVDLAVSPKVRAQLDE